MINCEICKKEFKNYNGNSFTLHLKNFHKITTKKYFDNYMLKYDNDCLICGDKTKFISISKGYSKLCGKKECSTKSRMKSCQEKYGKDYISQTKTWEDKTQETCQKRYGGTGFGSKILNEKYHKTLKKNYKVEHPHQSKEIMDKINKNYFDKHGVEYPNQNPEVREKSRKTNLKLYGKENYFQTKEFLEKRDETCLDKYKVKNYTQTDEYLEKSKNIFREKYGVDNPMQDPNIFNKNQKSGYKFKDYKLPSGRIIEVQGYEPQMLDVLFEQGYKEEDLVIQQRKEMPEIWYYTSDQKKHRYYPDIFIISENKIIEVKSEYTYDVNLEINLLKQQACLDAGYKFEFKIL